MATDAASSASLPMAAVDEAAANDGTVYTRDEREAEAERAAEVTLEETEGDAASNRPSEMERAFEEQEKGMKEMKVEVKRLTDLVMMLTSKLLEYKEEKKHEEKQSDHDDDEDDEKIQN